MKNIKKTEYIAINTGTRFEKLIDDDVGIKQIENLKHLGLTIDNKGLGKEEVKTRIQCAVCSLLP